MTQKSPRERHPHFQSLEDRAAYFLELDQLPLSPRRSASEIRLFPRARGTGSVDRLMPGQFPADFDPARITEEGVQQKLQRLRRSSHRRGDRS